MATLPDLSSSYYVVLLIYNFLQLSSGLNKLKEVHESATFSQFCNSSIPCSKAALLTCLDSTCSCIFPESMTFLEEQGSCFSLAGERCGSHLSLDPQDSFQVPLPCVPFALCNANAECECRPSHWREKGSGLCLPKGGMGQGCREDGECESGFCSFQEGRGRGQCECRPGEAVRSSLFSLVEDEESLPHTRCLVKPGKPCSEREACVPNAECLSRKCRCRKGFKPSKSGKFCVGLFNSTCDPARNNWCEKGLACINGACSCPKKWDQVWDKESARCLTLTGGACKGDENCVENAACREESKVCECRPNFVENGVRTCDLRHGMSCSSSEMTLPNCDSLAGLQCINGNCTCPFGTYSEEGGCVQVLGGFCTKIRGPKCGGNAVCKLRRGGLLPFGRCSAPY